MPSPSGLLHHFWPAPNVRCAYLDRSFRAARHFAAGADKKRWSKRVRLGVDFGRGQRWNLHGLRACSCDHAKKTSATVYSPSPSQATRTSHPASDGQSARSCLGGNRYRKERV